MDTKGLTNSLVDDLRTLIVTGQFEPGTRVNEIALASDLCISRSPLREALRTLENEGLILGIHRKGSFVTQVSLEDLTELFQIREMIECYAISLLKKKGITKLEKALKVAEKSITIRIPSPKDSSEIKLAYINAMANFHIELINSADNQQLSLLFKKTNTKNNRYVYMNAFANGSTKHSINEHFKILEHINKKDYETAKQLMRTHIYSNFKLLGKAYGDKLD